MINAFSRAITKRTEGESDEKVLSRYRYLKMASSDGE